ncbi:hypothetical protein HK097_001091, partial [Rhizophlyctis rosea]
MALVDYPRPSALAADHSLQMHRKPFDGDGRNVPNAERGNTTHLWNTEEVFTSPRTKLAPHPLLPPIADPTSTSPSPTPQRPAGTLAVAAELNPQTSHHLTPSSTHSISHHIHGHLHPHSDTNRDPSNPSPLLVSLHVCTTCQQALMSAFEHCLSKHTTITGSDQADGSEGKRGNLKDIMASPDDESTSSPSATTLPLLDSLNAIDEMQDAQRLTSPPVFDIVKDPTIKKNVVYIGVKEKVEKDRWVKEEAQKDSEKEDPGNMRVPAGDGKRRKGWGPDDSGPKSIGRPDAGGRGGAGGGSGGGDDDGRGPTPIPEAFPVDQPKPYPPSFGGALVRGLGINTPHLFSSALYKRALAAKDREIALLRSHLYTLTMEQKFSTENISKLRHALKRSVSYYLHAEEWVDTETERLQMDVRVLKGEVACLMAFLIDSEEDKRNLRVHITNLNKTIGDKDSHIGTLNQDMSTLKQKLHTSFKEFLEMSETMAHLRKEADRGSDILQARNDLLQRNLEKLSRDFEITSKELSTKETRVKELEFELEELVTQFNSTGEAKQRSEELNSKLSGELDKTTLELKQTRHAYEISQLQNRQLEEEVREMNRIHTDMKYDLNIKVTNLTKEVENGKSEKKDLEGQIKLLKSETEKLSNALKSLTRSKDAMESAHRVSTQKSEKERQMLTTKISELQSLREEDQKLIRKLSDQREQLMFQVTDLQNLADRETANVNILNFELAQTKRQMEEKVALLEEQIEKLNVAKGVLGNDKRQVLEKYKLTRNELKEREGELEALKGEHARVLSEAAKMEEGLRGEISGLKGDLAKLRGEYERVDALWKGEVEVRKGLGVVRDDLTSQVQNLTQKNSQGSGEITALKNHGERLKLQIESLATQLTDTKTHLQNVLSNVADLTRQIQTLERESSEKVKDRDGRIRELDEKLYTTTEHNGKLSALNKKLKSMIDRLEIDLAQTKDKLQSETETRETLESALHTLRLTNHSLQSSQLKTARIESRHLSKQQLRELEISAYLKTRERMMERLRKSVVEEVKELEGIVGLLPGEEDLKVVEGPGWRKFREARGEKVTPDDEG